MKKNFGILGILLVVFIATAIGNLADAEEAIGAIERNFLSRSEDEDE